MEDVEHPLPCLRMIRQTGPAPWRNSSTRINRDRREIEQDMVTDAEMLAAQDPSLAQSIGVLRCAMTRTFTMVVVGIVAGRLREKLRYVEPLALPRRFGWFSGEVKGGSSLRKYYGLNIRDVLDVIATRHPGAAIKFGGHAMAAGTEH